MRARFVPSRYHALDSLRGHDDVPRHQPHAMAPIRRAVRWLIRPLQTIEVLSIRRSSSSMPSACLQVFYAVAGLLTALLLERYGWRQAIVNRFWRIAVLLHHRLPAARAADVLPLRASEDRHGGGRVALRHVGALPVAGAPLHLWFLEYLLPVSCRGRGAGGADPAHSEKWHAAPLSRVVPAAGLQAVWAPLPMAALTSPDPAADEVGGPAGSGQSFAPAPHILLASLRGFLLFSAGCSTSRATCWRR